MSATAGKPYFWKAGALVSIVVAAAGVSLWALGSTPLQGDLVSGGGSMSSGPNKLTGSLGSPFSTTPIQNALGQRIQPGSPTRAAPKGVLGDINGDLSVDFADFILFAQALLVLKACIKN